MTVFNGELVVVGDFTTAGGVLVNGMARWNGWPLPTSAAEKAAGKAECRSDSAAGRAVR